MVNRKDAADRDVSSLGPCPYDRERGYTYGTGSSMDDMTTGTPVEILVVEDNPDDLDLTLHALRRYTVVSHIHVVRDGVEALEFLLGADGQARHQAVTRLQMILLDLHLPRVDGLEVLRHIKAGAPTREIPVVMFTSSNEERDIAACYALGVHAYIIKPVDSAHYEEAMRQVSALLPADPSAAAEFPA
jgi:CheY-like chemotaxis protein